MKKTAFLFLIVILVMGGCKPKQQGLNTGPVQHTGWSRCATIYEVNIRQYTPQGTFKALQLELPRLRKMGIDILWLMPINPLGEKNRKGSLGSYYSVRDYLAVNPEYGNLHDFKDLVKTAHSLGMKVIIDWVANHTSWDNNLIIQHPDWYKKNSLGNIIAPVADWTDVAGLDYSSPELRKYMTDALAYWVKETDIDGYRCDVAGMLPVDFWNHAIPEIRKIKPLFMLAEDASPKIHDTGFFDATYSWNLFQVMNQIAKGNKTADKIDTVYALEKRQFSPDAYLMRFTSNHDENSWNGTEYERLGDGAQAFAVLTFTFPGIPLVYSGQESAMQKRLRFFDKDTIPWGNYPLGSFYSKLTQLKKKDTLLLAAGKQGGDFIKVSTSNDKEVYAFLRKIPGRQIFVLLNLSPKKQMIQLNETDFPGEYSEIFTGIAKDWKAGEKVKLMPWQYFVYETR